MEHQTNFGQNEELSQTPPLVKPDTEKTSPPVEEQGIPESDVEDITARISHQRVLREVSSSDQS